MTGFYADYGFETVIQPDRILIRPCASDGRRYSSTLRYYGSSRLRADGNDIIVAI